MLVKYLTYQDGIEMTSKYYFGCQKVCSKLRIADFLNEFIVLLSYKYCGILLDT